MTIPIKIYDWIGKPNNDFWRIARSEINGINRYWVAVGPKVMVPEYPFTYGKEIASNEMKYGTLIDVVLRDSNYQVYFMPAIVGDIKEHTLDKEYGEKVILLSVTALVCAKSPKISTPIFAYSRI